MKLRFIKIFNLLCLLIIGGFHSILAQTINFYPDQFGHVSQYLSLINPVYFNTASLHGFKSASKAGTGAFSEINTLYLQGNYTITKNSNQQWIGADLQTEQEGPVIRKNRIRVHYALKKNIARYLFVSFGAHLGLATYGYQGKSSNAQGSSNGPDGSLGLLINYKNWNMGMHLNQFFNHLYQPKNTSFRYPIYYGIYLDKSWKLNQGSKCKLFVLNHFLQQRSFLTTLGGSYLIKELLELILNYTHNQYLTPSIGFKLKKGESELEKIAFFFAYNIPIQTLASSQISSFEIGLKINCFDLK